MTPAAAPRALALAACWAEDRSFGNATQPCRPGLPASRVTSTTPRVYCVGVAASARRRPKGLWGALSAAVRSLSRR